MTASKASPTVIKILVEGHDDIRGIIGRNFEMKWSSGYNFRAGERHVPKVFLIGLVSVHKIYLFLDPCMFENGGCMNGSTCSIEDFHAVCNCSTGFTGAKCDQGKIMLYFLVATT